MLSVVTIKIPEEKEKVTQDLDNLGKQLNKLRQQEATITQAIHERVGILNYLKLLEVKDEPDRYESKPQNRTC